MKKRSPVGHDAEITPARSLHHVKSRYSRWLDLASATSVTFLMFSGSLKSAHELAWIPVDLTAVAMVLVGSCILLTVWPLRRSWRFWTSWSSRGVPVITVGALIMFAALIPGFFIGTANPSTRHTQLAVLISIYTATGALLLLQTAVRRKIWLWSLAVLGLVVVPLLRTDSVDGTRSVGGTGATINAGQMLGISVVVLLVFIITGRIRGRNHVLLAAFVVAVLGYELISTGARGPTIAVAAALLATVVLLRPHLWKRTVIAVLVFVVGLIALGSLGFAGAERMRLAASGSLASSPRVVLWEQSLQALPVTPGGCGWGNFWAVLSPDARLGSGYVQHPHNLFLEAFVEGGWIAGIAVTVFVVLALRRQWRAADDRSVEVALLAVAIFYVLCSMVSGSMGDDRAAFAVLAAAFATSDHRIISWDRWLPRRGHGRLGTRPRSRKHVQP